MSKIIIVSNRLPVSIQKKDGEFTLLKSSGGLVSAMSSVYNQENVVWIGWPGISVTNKEEEQYITELLAGNKMKPVFLEEAVMEKFYSGFSNNTIWPLFHYFPKLTDIQEGSWKAYKKANKAFAEAVLDIAEDEDTVWVHDYHLFLLPKLLRKKMAKLSIGFFLHIPFPSYEIFRILPPRIEILKGVLGADLIGFHTYDDIRHFLSSVSRLLGWNNVNGFIEINDRKVKVDAFPISIDYQKYAKLSVSESVVAKAKELRTRLGEHHYIISVDRLDLSKGIPEKLKAYERFLDTYPEYKSNCSLILQVVPSRTNVPAYKELKKEIEQEVGRINGKFSRVEWAPVIYLYRSVSNELLSALYVLSDVALITPLRDGMNLVSKEYVASKQDGKGVLILSEMAGASKELSDALIVNPFDIADVAESIYKALTMSESEKMKRNKRMQQRIRRSNVHVWSKLFLQKLNEVKEMNIPFKEKLMDKKQRAQLIVKYAAAEKRIIFLDYDGTLVPFNVEPFEAKPDVELIEILQNLSSDPKNKVVIISGRDRHILKQWFGELKIDMVAEHGVWTKKADKDWQLCPTVEDSWKVDFMPLFEDYVDRTPGTFIEEKDYSIVWHYRQADPEFGKMRSHELHSHLDFMISNRDLKVMEGNKVLELKHASTNKGLSAASMLNNKNYDFILALGDDHTDEDLFKAIGEQGTTIKVGKVINTNAAFYLPTYIDVRKLLKKLSLFQKVTI